MKFFKRKKKKDENREAAIVFLAEVAKNLLRLSEEIDKRMQADALVLTTITGIAEDYGEAAKLWSKSKNIEEIEEVLGEVTLNTVLKLNDIAKTFGENTKSLRAMDKTLVDIVTGAMVCRKRMAE